MFEFNFALEIAAFLAGLIFYKKIRPVIYRLIIPLLFVTIMNEGLSHYGFYSGMALNKAIFYNLFFLLQFIIVGIVYVSVLSVNGINKSLTALFVISLGVQLFLLFRMKAASFDPNYISLICGSLIIFSFYYLYDIYVRGTFLNLKSDMIFWFSVGSIIAQFLLLLFINALRVETFKSNASSMMVFKYLNTIGNVFYYLCICYSFLCTSLYRRLDGI